MSGKNYSELIRIAELFCIDGRCCSVRETGNGHINDTFLVSTDRRRYILQRINTHVFTDPAALMENVVAATEYLKSKNGDAGRMLSYIPTWQGQYFTEQNGLAAGSWRMMTYIENAYSCESPRVLSFEIDSTDELRDGLNYQDYRNYQEKRNESYSNLYYEIGKGYGKFISDLAGFPAEKLHETISGFHDTRRRFNHLLEAIERDTAGRKASALDEIRFALDHEGNVDILGDMSARGELPLRVTHNDTKINNVMLDRDTNQAVCVIDLDTVMPGLAVNDFGDMVRSCACTGREDETDISGIGLDLAIYSSLEKGFSEGFPDMTAEERRMLPVGARIMTLECGIRFLTDYLEGDTYFKTDYPEHNLIRCRTQFRLLKDMESKLL